MSPDKPLPLAGGEVLWNMAGDVVANGLGLLPVAQDLAPCGDDAPRVGEPVFHCAGRADGDRPLLDAPVPLFGGAVGGLGFGEGALDGFEQLPLVGLNLQEVFAAALDDGPGGFALAVERIGRDGLPIERGELREQVLRGLQLAVFAVAFFLEQWAMASGAPVSWSARVSTPTVSRMNLPSMASAPGNEPERSPSHRVRT